MRGDSEAIHQDFITESTCRDNRKDDDGRFYFWRNAFLSIVGIIFLSIGACYLYINVKTEVSTERILASDKSIALIQKDVDYIRTAVDELKSMQKELQRK